MLVGLLISFITSPPLVSAENINWKTVKRIDSKSELAKYIEIQRKAGKSTIPIVLTNGLTVNIKEFITLCPSSVVTQKTVANDGRNILVIYTLTDYPGTKVANAYLAGNTNQLTPEEKKLYAEAVKIINEAKKYSHAIEREVYIYEQIMNRASYQTGDMSTPQRFTTATGALIDGKANCQGYSDAFYMLGRMCGLNVGRMSGQVGGGGHSWNTITFEDGKTYCVDVTLGDNAIGFGGFRNFNSYVYFNAPVEIMQATHTWDWSLAPANLQPSIDGRYSYCVFGSNLARTNNAESGLKLIAKKIGAENKKWFSVLVPFDERFSAANIKQTLAYLVNELSAKYHSQVQVYLYDKKYGDYLIFMVAVP